MAVAHPARPTRLGVVAVPAALEEDDPPLRLDRLPQVEARLRSVVARNGPVGQEDALQRPRRIDDRAAALLTVRALDRVALDREPFRRRQVRRSAARLNYHGSQYNQRQ